MSILAIKDLTFSYTPDPPILKKISVDIQQGTSTVILGSNGSGKTTLLKLCSRLLVPDAGEIVLGYEALQNLSQKQIAQSIAFVPQNISPIFSLTVFDFILLGRAPHLQGLSFETKQDIDIAVKSLEAVNALSLKNRHFHSLSEGEKQRVLLGKALAQQPKLLLLDEPTAHLDIKYQLETMVLLREIQREQNLTIVMVLHDFQLASEFADEVILLKDKQIFAKGAPKNLFTEKALHEVFGVHMGIDNNPFTQNVRTTLKELQ